MPDQGIFSGNIPGTYALNLSPNERDSLARAASERQMSEEEWIGSLILEHLGRGPTWNRWEREELKAMVSQAQQMITLVENGALPRDIAGRQLDQMFTGFGRRLDKMTDRHRRYWLAA